MLQSCLIMGVKFREGREDRKDNRASPGEESKGFIKKGLFSLRDHLKNPPPFDISCVSVKKKNPQSLSAKVEEKSPSPRKNRRDSVASDTNAAANDRDHPVNSSSSLPKLWREPMLQSCLIMGVKFREGREDRKDNRASPGEESKGFIKKGLFSLSPEDHQDDWSASQTGTKNENSLGIPPRRARLSSKSPILNFRKRCTCVSEDLVRPTVDPVTNDGDLVESSDDLKRNKTSQKLHS